MNFNLSLIVGVILTIFIVSVFGNEKVESICPRMIYNGSAERPNLIIAVHHTNYRMFSMSRDALDVCKLNGISSNKSVETFGNITTGDYKLKMGYDFNTKSIYTVEDSAVYRQNSEGKKQLGAQIWEFGRWAHNVQSISIDWVTNNIYLNNPYAGVLVVKLGKTPEKSIAKKLLEYPNFKIDGYAMLVHPNKGYLFLQHGNMIKRVNLDGSNYTTVVRFISDYKIELRENEVPKFTLDYHEDRIYWSSTMMKTFSSDLDGNDVRNFTITGNKSHAYTVLMVDAKYVYYEYVLDHGYNIFRADKFTGAQDPDFFVGFDKMEYAYNWQIFPFLVQSERPYEARNDHPCKINNGGCLGFCFGVPNDYGHFVKKCDDDFPIFFNMN